MSSKAFNFNIIFSVLGLTVLTTFSALYYYARSQSASLSTPKQHRRRQLVILRGGMACGKSTAFKAMSTRPAFRGNWCFIDFPVIKRFFAHTEGHRTRLGKACLWDVLRRVLKDESKLNIMIEEMHGDAVREALADELAAANCMVRVIHVKCEANVSMARNIERRSARGMEPRPRKEMDANHAWWNDPANAFTQKCDWSIDTTELSQEQVAERIEHWVLHHDDIT